MNLTGRGNVPEVTFAESVIVGSICDSVFGKVYVMVICVSEFLVTLAVESVAPFKETEGVDVLNA